MHARLLKLILVGDGGVGKTAILRRFVYDKFNTSHQATIGIDFICKQRQNGEVNTTLQLWDSAGDERYRTITTVLYRGTDACLIVFDPTKKSTFKKASEWVEEVKHHATNVPLVLVANKSDSLDPREISTAEAREYAESIDASYYEVSAATGHGINNMFQQIAESLVKDLTDALAPSIAPTNNNKNPEFTVALIANFTLEQFKEEYQKQYNSEYFKQFWPSFWTRTTMHTKLGNNTVDNWQVVLNHANADASCRSAIVLRKMLQEQAQRPQPSQRP